jgi:hypothetical protein
MEKPFVRVTWCSGFSLTPHSVSPGEHPIWNVPGGIQTYAIPSFGFIFLVPLTMVARGITGALGWTCAGGLPGTSFGFCRADHQTNISAITANPEAASAIPRFKRLFG